MSTLADHQIRELCLKRGLIEPFDEALLQPASYDVRLGDRFMVVDADRRWAPPRPVDMADPSTLVDLYTEFTVGSEGYELAPHAFVLAHTVEVVWVPPELVAQVSGKSSIARIGLTVESAGYIDPGYRGTITLEVANLSPVPIVMRPGMPIAQFSFQALDAVPELLYGSPSLGSHYQGATSVVGSRYGVVREEAGLVDAPAREERREDRPCRGCGDPFQPGQSYVEEGPYHLGCAVPAKRRGA